VEFSSVSPCNFLNKSRQFSYIDIFVILFSSSRKVSLPKIDQSCTNSDIKSHIDSSGLGFWYWLQYPQVLFLVYKISRPVVGPTQPPTSTQWVPVALSPRGWRPGREADHSSACSTAVEIADQELKAASQSNNNHVTICHRDLTSVTSLWRRTGCFVSDINQKLKIHKISGSWLVIIISGNKLF